MQSSQLSSNSKNNEIFQYDLEFLEGTPLQQKSHLWNQGRNILIKQKQIRRNLKDKGWNNNQENNLQFFGKTFSQGIKNNDNLNLIQNQAQNKPFDQQELKQNQNSRQKLLNHLMAQKQLFSQQNQKRNSQNSLDVKANISQGIIYNESSLNDKKPFSQQKQLREYTIFASKNLKKSGFARYSEKKMDLREKNHNEFQIDKRSQSSQINNRVNIIRKNQPQFNLNSKQQSQVETPDLSYNSFYQLENRDYKNYKFRKPSNSDQKLNSKQIRIPPYLRQEPNILEGLYINKYSNDNKIQETKLLKAKVFPQGGTHNKNSVFSQNGINKKFSEQIKAKSFFQENNHYSQIPNKEELFTQREPILNKSQQDLHPLSSFQLNKELINFPYQNTYNEINSPTQRAIIFNSQSKAEKLRLVMHHYNLLIRNSQTFLYQLQLMPEIRKQLKLNDKEIQFSLYKVSKESVFLAVFIQFFDILSQNTRSKAAKILQFFQMDLQKPISIVPLDTIIQFHRIFIHRDCPISETCQFLESFFEIKNTTIDNLISKIRLMVNQEHKQSIQSEQQKVSEEELFQYWLNQFQYYEIINLNQNYVDQKQFKKIIFNRKINAYDLIDLICGYQK